MMFKRASFLAVALQSIFCSSVFAMGVSTSQPPTDVDVVIVGGGFSGLMSAYDLQQAGLKTVVLEAKPIVGGRSRSQPRRSGEGIIELGATWINNSTQPKVTALVSKFGLDTAVQYTAGDVIFQGPDGRARRLAPGSLVNADNLKDAASEVALMTLFSLASATVDLRDPKKFLNSQDLNVAEWIAQFDLWGLDYVRNLTGTLTRALVGREPREIGIHYMLDYIKSGFGIVSLNSEDEKGAQYLKIKHGTTAIATSLVKAMTPGSVITNMPVKAINQSNGTTIVTAQSGQVFRAKKAIIAIPTNTYRNITFSPALPPSKETLVSNTKPGIYAKMILSYSEPWWRHANLSGKFTSVDGPACFGWDTSDPSKSQYSLAVFIAGDFAVRWHALPEAERRASVIRHVEVLFGQDLAARARDVLEVNYVEWTKEEFLGGAPTSSMGPGLLRKYGEALREPHGHVHFGGGETAYEWKGYLEGAVAAGQRAAEEVVAALKRN